MNTSDEIDIGRKNFENNIKLVKIKWIDVKAGNINNYLYN